jgi:hypothetical protein
MKKCWWQIYNKNRKIQQNPEAIFSDSIKSHPSHPGQSLNDYILCKDTTSVMLHSPMASTDASRLILTADCTLFAEIMTVIPLHLRTTSKEVCPPGLSRIQSHLYIGFVEAIVNKYQEYVQPSGLLTGVRHTGSQPESGYYTNPPTNPANQRIPTEEQREPAKNSEKPAKASKNQRREAGRL